MKNKCDHIRAICASAYPEKNDGNQIVMYCESGKDENDIVTNSYEPKYCPSCGKKLDEK